MPAPLRRDPRALDQLLRDGLVRRAPALAPGAPRSALVSFDLGDLYVRPPARKPRGVIEVVRFEKKLPNPGALPWARLARRAEKHGGALLVPPPLPHTATFASAVVELERGRAQ